MSTIATLLLASASLTSPRVPAAPTLLDAPAPGFRLDEATSVGAFELFATLSGSQVLVFDGSAVEVVDLATGARTTAATLPVPGFPSFVVVEPDHAHALAGVLDGAADAIWRVDLATGVAATVGAVWNNFAAVVEDAGHLLVSAAASGIAFPNEIVRLDLATGATTTVAVLDGPSGPVARAPDGDLYYGQPPSAFPPPPASSRVLRFTRAQVESGVVLGVADAEVFLPALDGVGGIAVDPRTFDVIVAESRAPGWSEVRAYHDDGSPAGVIAEAPRWIAGVEATLEPGAGSLHAWQPAGVALRYLSIDYGAFPYPPARLLTLRAARPKLEVAFDGTNAEVEVSGASPNASVLVASAPLGSASLPEATIAGPEFPFHTALPLAAWHGALVAIPTDAFGRGSTTLPAAAQTVWQALALDAQGTLLGTTTPAVVR